MEKDCIKVCNCPTNWFGNIEMEAVLEVGWPYPFSFLATMSDLEGGECKYVLWLMEMTDDEAVYLAAPCADSTAVRLRKGKSRPESLILRAKPLYIVTWMTLPFSLGEVGEPLKVEITNRKDIPKHLLPSRKKNTDVA